jgi:tetratricopeptide (TPR) repeat protein
MLKIAFVVIMTAWSSISFSQPAKTDALFPLINARKTADAEKLLAQRYTSSPKDDQFHYWTGRIQYQKGDVEAALVSFEKAAKAKSGVSEYHLWTGRAAGGAAQKASVFRQPGLAKQCKNEFEKAVQLDPKSVDARVDLIGYYLQAPGIMGGSVENAEKTAAEVEKLDPWQGVFARIRVENKKENAAAVEQIYRKAITSWPDSIQFTQGFGNWLYEKKRFDEAADFTRKALAKKPAEWGLQYQLSKIAAVSGKFTQEALPLAEKLASAPPIEDKQWRAYFHFRHGQILEHLGRKPEARTAYQNSVALKPDLEDAKKGLERTK